MTQKAIHVIIEGRVQGVFFRACTRDEAVRLGLYGWVRNLPDGSVEALIAGEEQTVDRMLEWLQTGPPMADVARVVFDPVHPTPDEKDFSVIY
ncbi:MAG: acylphosphatase [Desulfobulbaceae bacterium]|uniref:Acylphosphatase n=1 Tax=Candidatus Desulfobia pelagia TaxID=2841692 RepID=A0A8J6TFA7_9BACT|nr:acylphosphatase [Candidatus Desulfobia pelagia]